MCFQKEQGSRSTAVQLSQELRNYPDLCLARPMDAGQDVADQIALIMGDPRIGLMRVAVCPKGKSACSMLTIR